MFNEAEECSADSIVARYVAQGKATMMSPLGPRSANFAFHINLNFDLR